MRFVAYVTLAVLLLVPVSALLEPEGLDPAYYGGSLLKPVLTVSSGTDFSGFFKVTLTCQDYAIEYYAAPLLLAAGVPQQLVVPPLQLPPRAVGLCAITARLVSADLSEREHFVSQPFLVTTAIPLLVHANISSLAPGKDVLLTVSTSAGYAPSSATARFRLGNASWEFPFIAPLLTAVVTAPANIPAGEYPLAAALTDNRGNRGDNFTVVVIPSVPTRVAVNLRKATLEANERFSFSALLVDQTGMPLSADVIHRITDADEHAVFETSVAGGEIVSYAFPPEVPPGEFILKSIALGFSASRFLTVLPTRQLSVDLHNSTVVVRNTGNVEYETPLAIAAKGEKRQLDMQDDVALRPGGSYAADLARTLPDGSYDVTVKTGNLTSFAAVPVHDHRSALTRLSQGMTSITGNAVAFTSNSTKSVGTVLAFWVVVLTVAVVAFLSRRPRPKQQPPVPPTKTVEKKKDDIAALRERPDVKKFVEDSLKKRRLQ